MQYHLEQRLRTMSKLTMEHSGPSQVSFPVENVFVSREGEEYWLCATDIEAGHYIEAWRQFIHKLARIVPTVAFISQCSIEHREQPLLIKPNNMNVAFIHWIFPRKPVGLGCMEQERTALRRLLTHTDVPEEFFYYWCEAGNTSGYSSKLLLMLSAVEALTGVSQAERKSKKTTRFYERLEEILGRDLTEVFWGTEKEHNPARRHRLRNGEYLDPKNKTGMDYVSEVHRSVVRYFNERIFKDHLLDDVSFNPHRHFLGTEVQYQSLIRSKGEAKLCLMQVLADAEEHDYDISKLAGYEILPFDPSIEDIDHRLMRGTSFSIQHHSLQNILYLRSSLSL